MKNLENKNIFKELVDKNSNGKIDKNELEILASQVELQKLKNEIIGQNWENFIPEKYQEEIKNKDHEEKLGYVYLFKLGEEILGKEQLEKLVKFLPLDEITLFLYELAVLEKQKDLEKTATIILTEEEIKQLKQILASTATNNKLQALKKFIETQSKQNITSAQLIEKSKLKETLEKNKININNFDLIFFKFLEQQLPNISKDTLRNMATGFTLYLIKIFNKINGKIDLKKLLTLDGLKSIIIENKERISAFKKISEFLNILKKQKELEKNTLLNNPKQFSEFLLKITTENFSKKEIEKEITKKPANKPIIFDKNTKESLAENLKKTFDKTAKLLNKHPKITNKISSFSEGIEEIKDKFESLKEGLQPKIINYVPSIFGFVEFLKKFGIWKYIRNLFDQIANFLGYNSFDNFESKVETKQFPKIIDWFKTHLTAKNLPKESIFYQQKINKVKINGHLSYNTLIWIKENTPNENQTETILNYVFSKKYFDIIIKKLNISKKDFYKKLLKVEEKQNSNKKIKILEINFDYLNKILEKYINKEKNPNLIATTYQNLKVNKRKNIYTQKTKLENTEINNRASKFENKTKTLGINNFDYKSYTQAIATIESGGNYKAKNKASGALGKYQFMLNTLKDYKKDICGNQNCSDNEIKNKFLSNPVLQEKIMWKYTMGHLAWIKKHYKKLEKKGIVIKSDKDLAKILAKCHFTGCGNLTKNYSDGNMSANHYAELSKKLYNENKNVA